MSGVHKHPTISFRVSDREREMIEAKTVYNRTIKVNRIMDGIPYNVKKEYVKEFKEYFEEQVERIISEYFE